MAELKKKSCIRVRASQLEIIVEYLERNPQLNGMKFSANFTAAKRSELWEELCLKLNSSGGGVKNVKSWQKCWSDKKSEVKKKHNTFKNARLKTGGGPNEEKPLTALEERILQLIGLDAAEGSIIEESTSMAYGYIIPREDFPASSASGSCLNSEPFTLDYSPSPFNLMDVSLVEEVEDSNMPSNTPKSKDDRLLRKRVRTKPVILKAETAKKMVEGQLELAMAVKRIADAKEKENELRERAMTMENRKEEKENELRERAMAIENRKADAFEGILNFLRNKFP